MGEEYTYSDDTDFINGSENVEVLSLGNQKALPDKPSVANISKVGSFIRTKVKPSDGQENQGKLQNDPVNVGNISQVDSFLIARIKTSNEEENQKNEVTSVSEVERMVETEKVKETAETTAATSQIEKNLSPVTHVIFDLDGTLLDTETINNRIIADIAEEYDKEFTPEIQCRVMGRIASEASITAVQLLNIPMTPEEFDARVQDQNNKLMAEVNLMPGADRLIRHLHRNHVPIAVATSAAKANYDIKSTRHKELFSLFHHIVAGGSDPEVIIGKPAPDIYLVCASRFPDNPKPHQCLAIEDSANGVKSAVNAGMQVVMIPDPCTKPEFCKDATLVLKSMVDFKPELFGLPKFESE